MKSNSPNEGSIKVYEFPENVRKKPGMYIGERGNEMAFTALREAMDNVIDERLAGRNTLLEVYVNNKKNEYIVADAAQGIPVGMNKDYKISTLTLVLTRLHAGGKLDAEESTYKASRGTHGVGVSATNAVSEKFEVWTCRDKVWYHQSFAKGINTTEVIKQKPPAEVLDKLQKKHNKGTILRIKLDQTIVSGDKGKTKAIVEKKPLIQWLKNTALMVGDLEVVCNIDGFKKSWKNTKGIGKMLKSKLKKLGEPATMGKPFIHDDGQLRVAMQWADYPQDDGLTSYVNALPTSEGGEHINGFVSALSKAIDAHKTDKPKKAKKGKASKGAFSSRDLLFGLVGVFNIDVQSPEFNGQLKNKLTSKVAKQVEDAMAKPLKDFFEKNKGLAKKVIKRAKEVKKSKEEFAKLMKGVSAVKQGQKGTLPTKLVQAKRCKPAERELYLVEGDSAAGTAKMARNTKNQEIYPLTGKILNAIRAKPADLLKSKVIRELLISLGYDFKAKGDDLYKRLRVQKGVYLLADPDVDGLHINILLLSLLWKQLPKLFDDGKVFICNAPLYSTYYKGNRYYGEDFQSVSKQLPKGANSQIIRSKGWGELAPETLEAIAFEPKTRYAIQVKPVKGKELNYFLALMGSDTQARKTLLGLA